MNKFMLVGLVSAAVIGVTTVGALQASALGGVMQYRGNSAGAGTQTRLETHDVTQDQLHIHQQDQAECDGTGVPAHDGTGSGGQYRHGLSN